MALDAQLRPATRRDAALILRLEEAGMRAYAEALWGGWTPSATSASLVLDGHEMILLSGRAVGCIACDWAADHLRIRKLYVAPDHRGGGLGAVTLRTKLRMAAIQGVPLRLTVLVSNTPAQRFYKREGLCEVQRTAERITFEWTPPQLPQ